MPHFPNTPESLLRRNDSKDASTTCRGITASGRACRRTLGSPKSSPTARRSHDPKPPIAENYCWQHQEQACQGKTQRDSNSPEQIPTQSTTPTPLRGKSSIDTLVQKLGINIVESEGKRKRNQPSYESRQPQWTDEKGYAHGQNDMPARAIVRAGQHRKKPGFWVRFCCIKSDKDDDYMEIVRHKKRVEQSDHRVIPLPQRPSSNSGALMALVEQKPSTKAAAAGRGGSDKSHHRSTEQLLRLIPSSVTTSVTSGILAELAKPISPHDEAGYIYIFWLTPQFKDRPDDSAVHALLFPPGARPRNSRRVSDVMTEFSLAPEEGTNPQTSKQENRRKRTVLLKIGRANNITRRMNEWQRQCGYALNLVRWYPYIVSATADSNLVQQSAPRERLKYLDAADAHSSRSKPAGDVHKCPHVHRVERLIHLELTEKRVRRQCDACGKEHREWFQVDATQAGVRAIDETIKRWIGWAIEHC